MASAPPAAAGDWRRDAVWDDGNAEDRTVARYPLPKPLEPGEWVELEGMLIYRQDETMVEVVDGTIRRLADAAGTPPPRGAGKRAHTCSAGSATVTVWS